MSNKGPASLKSLWQDVSEGSDVEVEQKIKDWMTKLEKWQGWNMVGCAIRWAVKARRKGRDVERSKGGRKKMNSCGKKSQSKSRYRSKGGK